MVHVKVTVDVIIIIHKPNYWYVFHKVTLPSGRRLRSIRTKASSHLQLASSTMPGPPTDTTKWFKSRPPDSERWCSTCRRDFSSLDWNKESDISHPGTALQGFIPLQADSIITAQFRLDSRNMEYMPYCSSSRTQVLWLKAPSRHRSALGIDCVSSADRWPLETPPSLQAGGDGRNVAQRAARCFWSSWRLQTLLSAPLQCFRPQIRHRASFWASRQQITCLSLPPNTDQ